MQSTDQLLMIRPVNFKFNEQTAENNKFQKASQDDFVQAKALAEFDNFVAVLRANGIDILVVDDTKYPETPDSIFPNNWVSFHESGTVILYPMFSENRRSERKPEVLKAIEQRFAVKNVIDLSSYENQNLFLEGTGSLVLDRQHKIAYACLSVRTNEQVIKDFSEKTGYEVLTFKAVDEAGFPIYHTNVMMCVADRYAVVCLKAISDDSERKQMIESLRSTDKEIVDITVDQMNHFAGNMLQAKNKSGESLLILSEQAYDSLTPDQVITLEKYSKFVYAPLDTIEQNGGGSARCMLAEIHLPLR
ncbi:MAG: arginine deiminase-related protein [Bacteroidota bacterium]